MTDGGIPESPSSNHTVTPSTKKKSIDLRHLETPLMRGSYM